MLSRERPIKSSSNIFSIRDWFIIQYQDPIHAKQLRYRSEYVAREGYGVDGIIGDVFDGIWYTHLSQTGHFKMIIILHF